MAITCITEARTAYQGGSRAGRAVSELAATQIRFGSWFVLGLVVFPYPCGGIMKKSVFRTLICLAITATSVFSFGQTSLSPNQTEGFGAGKLLRFTYTQNFDCVDQPLDDLNFNGKPAQSDPPELQIPICQAGLNPTINPPGVKGKATVTTDPLYVLIPMFSVNHDLDPNDAISCFDTVPGTLCGPALGKALIHLFGALPEAFKKKPVCRCNVLTPACAQALAPCTLPASI